MVDTRTSQVRGIGPRRNPPNPRPRQVTQPTVPGEQPPPPVVLPVVLPPIPLPIDPVIPPGLPPTIVPFARTPALAEQGILDYTSRQGYRIYGSATIKLDDIKYDGSADMLFPFLELMEERAKNYGWDNGIMMIPNQITGESDFLIHHYGTIPLSRINTHEATYISLPTRQAQDTALLYECLMNSLGHVARAKVTPWKLDYFCQGLPSGNLLLKVIIRECHLDTNATTAGIRQRLSSLDTYLPTIDYDVGKFNMHVKSLTTQLQARGEYSNDLLMNLFKGYMSATDKSFVAYIDKKMELYEEGTNISANQLMLWARQKYDLLREKGSWNAPTPEEEKIIALNAKIEDMQAKLKATTPTRSPGNNSRRQERKTKPEWFYVEPEDPLKTRRWENKEWNWCGKSTGGKCECFVIHKPSDCKGLRKRNSNNSNPPRSVEKKVKIDETLAQQAQLSAENDDGYVSNT